MAATVSGVFINGRDGRIDDTYEREYRLTYVVTTTDKDDGPQVVLASTGLPDIGDSYAVGNDANTNMYCVELAPRQTDSPTLWYVDVTYSNREQDPENQDQEADPTLKNAVVSYEFVTRTVPVSGYYDDAGNPSASGDWDQAITGPAGEPFNPPPEAENDDPVIVVVKNIANPSALLSANNTVNKSGFLGADARQLRLKTRAVPKTHPTIGDYYEVTARLHFRYETWDLQILNQGTWYIDASSQIQWEPNQLSPTVVNLTSTGGKLGSTDPPTFTRIKYYREVEFSTLGIYP